MKKIRKFKSGADRDLDDGKLDFEGFISPLVLKRFGEYMHFHRTRKDGTYRESDNWQKGISRDAYIKSAYRHFQDWHLHHRDFSKQAKEDLETALCALLFNVAGYLFEELK